MNNQIYKVFILLATFLNATHVPHPHNEHVPHIPHDPEPIPSTSPPMDIIEPLPYTEMNEHYYKADLYTQHLQYLWKEFYQTNDVEEQFRIQDEIFEMKKKADDAFKEGDLQEGILDAAPPEKPLEKYEDLDIKKKKKKSRGIFKKWFRKTKIKFDKIPKIRYFDRDD